MPSLRALLPLPTEELATVVALLIDQVGDLHDRGIVHGAITLDNTQVSTAGGACDVRLGPPRNVGTRRDDVVQVGSLLASALALSPSTRQGADPARDTLAEVAALARRALLRDHVDVRTLAAMIDGLPRVPPAVDADERSSSVSQARLALGAWLGLLLATVLLLPRVATHVSPPPLIEGLEASRRWFAERDLATAFVGILRVCVQATAWYLLASTVLAMVVELVPAAGGHRLRLVDRIVTGHVRRGVAAAFGVSLTVAAVAALPRPSGGPPSAAVEVALREPAVSQPAPTTTAAASLTIVELPVVPGPEPPGPAPLRTWTVAPGDHMWGIAERVLGEARGLAVNDDDVDPYWRRLIEANRDVVADPDVVFVGQVLRIPPP